MSVLQGDQVRMPMAGARGRLEGAKLEYINEEKL
jgi:hypothetical protein